MTMPRPALFLLLTFSLALFSVTSALSSADLGSANGKGRERKARASLHELLQRNRNIASSSAENLSFTRGNENRRVLVLGEGDDPPNYVYEDPDPRDQMADLYDTDVSTQGASSDVGDEVTKYQQPYTTINAPSYADPNLLAAVMDQADKANFRYPSEGKKTIVPKKNQRESTRTKIETPESKSNDLNPFELFPPAFHELLEIPIHTYANGTTYNPHDKHKMRRPNSPTITGGYANTNVNGQNSDKEDETEKERDFHPKRITPKRRRRPTVQATQNKGQTKAEPEIKTTRAPVRKPITPQRKRIVYTNLHKTSDGKRRLNRITPPGKGSKRRPVRPSLRFRTRAPIQKVTNPIETTTPLPEPTTTTTIMTTTTQFSTPTSRTRRPTPQLRPHINSPNRRPGNPFYPDKTNFQPPEEIKVREVFKTDEDTFFFETEEPPITTTQANNYDRVYEESHTFRQSSFDTPPRKINKIRNDIAFENEPALEEEFDTDQYHYSNTETDFSKDFYEMPSKQNHQKKTHEFRPSKRDPFVGKLPSYPPFMKSFEDNRSPLTIQSTTFAPLHEHEEKEFIQPTTFRPSQYFDNYYEVLPPVKNTYQHPTYERENYYSGNEFRETVVPFANSHSVRRPFPLTNAYAGPVERQRVQVPRQVPVYSPNPFFGGAHAIQEQVSQFDLHSPLKIEIPSPASPPRGVFSYDGRFSYDNAPPRRRIYRPNGGNSRPGGKRRGSFLSNLFKTRQVNRRSGISSSKAQVNDIKSKDGKHSKGDVDYVISYGPPPINGKKLVVIGPFKEPPIGAPRIFPGSPTSTYDHQPPTEPSLNLKPPSTFQTATSSETSTREPSFKVFNLPKESNEIIHYDDKISNFDQTGKMGVNLQQNEIEPRKQNKIAFNKVGNNIGRPHYNQNSQKLSPRSSATESVNRPLTVNHDNYHLFKEVSEEDKERIIAAKFEFPRESSVRRSGLERHIIPIPVPMLSSSGDQISKFHNLQVPHVPIIRKIGKTPTAGHRSIRIKNVYVPIQNSLPKIEKDHRVENAKQPAPSGSYTSTPERVTPYPKFTTKTPANEPQSYREPSVSDIKFGGWQAVGEPPIVSYVQEVTPLSFKLKGEINKQTEDSEDIPEDQVDDEVPSKDPMSLAEDDLVRFSSKLNVDAPEVVRSYLVNPPRKL